MAKMKTGKLNKEEQTLMDDPTPNPIDTTFEPPKPENAQQIAISGRNTIEQAIVKIIGLARREILLVLPQMHELWNNEEIGQKLLDFVRYSAKRDVFILMNSLDIQTNPNHQLVRLSQRLSDRIHLKQATALLETPVMDSDYLMIVDRQHMLRIDDIDKLTAWFDADFAARAQNYADSFLLHWPKAREIAEYRRFML